jgi:hypothetical protein
MERGNHFSIVRYLPALVLATLAVAGLSFFVSLTRAAGEPTLLITLDDVALTSGDTALVTFTFSAVPGGFSDADVDLSDAKGTLSPVTPSPDARIWTATFTPTAGVKDASNTITVGMAWFSASDGSTPLDIAVSPSFSISTVPHGSSSCPPTPTVTIVSPNGGETFALGSDVDVLWTMDGCQVMSLSLLLSLDGGATFGVVGSSNLPTSGYYRWSVLSAPSPVSLLQVQLIGPGGEVLASDATDAPFMIESIAPPAGGGTASPPAPPTPAPASPPSIDPVPPPASTNVVPAKPTSAPTPTPAPSAPPAKTFPGPSAPPVPNIPTPLLKETPASATPTPSTDTPMNDLEQNIPATDTTAAPVSVESVQGAVDTVSGFVPPAFGTAFSFLLGALAMFGVMLGAQQVMARARTTSPKRCVHCQGTGKEPEKKKAAETCSDCNGTGQVEDEDEPSTECPHCKGEGEDPCHRCKGSGKDASGQECPACKGGGKTLTGKQDEDGEGEVADCEICHGEGEVSSTIKKMIPCDKCGGTGKV